MNYEQAYLEMHNLLSLYLNVNLCYWLNEPDNAANPHYADVHRALNLSNTQQTHEPPTLSNHDARIMHFIAGMNTLFEAQWHEPRYIQYENIFSPSSTLDETRKTHQKGYLSTLRVP